MRHADYFINKGLTIDITSDDNLKLKGLSFLQDYLKNQVLQYAKQNKWRIIFELQTQNKSLDETINILWDKAIKLADWIENPDSDISLQKRTKYVPKLLEMSEQISELEKQITSSVKILPYGGKKYKGLNGIWYPYEKIESNILQGDDYA